MSGIERIKAERQRQIDVEGWTEDHDDEHNDGALAMAAAAYCAAEYVRVLEYKRSLILTILWPWKDEDWKPSPDDRVKELVKAGALIAAEIDRLERKQE